MSRGDAFLGSATPVPQPADRETGHIIPLNKPLVPNGEHLDACLLFAPQLFGVPVRRGWKRRCHSSRGRRDATMEA